MVGITDKKAGPEDRFWAYVTAFGALWGFGEITLGSFLMSLRIPFIGLVLASMGVMILVAQRRIFPVRGATIATGVVAALCKSISPGGIIIQPMVGIICEAMLVEIALSYIPTIYIAAPIGGILAASWSVFQQLAVHYFIYGRTIIELYVTILKKVSSWLGMSESAAWTTLGTFLGLMLLIGAAGGLLGLKLGRDAARALERGSQAGEGR